MGRSRGARRARRGPGGIGKARLVAELAAELLEAQPNATYLEARCEPSALEALAPIASALRGLLDLPQSSPIEVRDRLRASCPSAACAEALEQLLGAGELARESATPNEARDRIVMAVGDLIAARCALAPVLLVIEDLHWADPVLVELASTLLRRLEDAPLFVIATAREHHALLAAAHPVELRGLSKRAARALVAAVLGDGPSDRADAILERAEGNPLFAGHVRLVSLRAFTRAESGRPAEAVPVAEEALALARRSGDPKLVAAALRCIAFCVAMTGDHARSLPLRRQTLAAYEAIGNGRFASQQRTDIGADLLVLGDAAQAASSLERALEQARALGIRYTEGYALHNLGLARARLGAVDAGLAAEDEATLIAQQIGERRLAFACDSYRCVILLEAGRASEALRAIERGLAEPEEVHGHIAPCMRALRAAALVACGRRDEAAQEARRALAMCEAAGGMEEHQADLFLAAHDAGVDGALEQGARALFARASAVSDAELRASFLGRVPSHARLVLLAREAGLWPG